MTDRTNTPVALAPSIEGDRIEAPLRVLWMDLDEPATSLPADPRYHGYWVVSGRGTTPLDLVELPSTAASLTPDSLRDLLLARIGEGLGAATPPDETTVPDAALPRATVVVPTIAERTESLTASIAALGRLDYPDYEVVVVDNRPATRTDRSVWSRIEEQPRVRVVAEPQPGISAARNAGIAAATGTVIAFTDDDVEVGAGWLRAIGTRFVSQPDVDCVAGLVLPRELETPAQLLFESFGSEATGKRFQPETHRVTAPTASMWSKRRYEVTITRADGDVQHRWLYQLGGFMGANMAFRTRALAALGPFDVALGTGTPTKGGEDLDMLVRLLADGRAIGYEPRAVIQHVHRRTYAELTTQMHGYGVGFTALLTALVLRDPRHLLGLTHLVAPALSALRRPPAYRSAATKELPDDLRRAYQRGQLAGGPAYLRARWAARGARR